MGWEWRMFVQPRASAQAYANALLRHFRPAAGDSFKDAVNDRRPDTYLLASPGIGAKLRGVRTTAVAPSDAVEVKIQTKADVTGSIVKLKKYLVAFGRAADLVREIAAPGADTDAAAAALTSASPHLVVLEKERTNGVTRSVDYEVAIVTIAGGAEWVSMSLEDGEPAAIQAVLDSLPRDLLHPPDAVGHVIGSYAAFVLYASSSHTRADASVTGAAAVASSSREAAGSSLRGGAR